jgi:DNA polymerase-3 subunit beta
VPRKTVSEVRKLLDEGDGSAEVSISDSKISFSCGNALLISKLIDGTFPEYSKVIPDNSVNMLEVEPAALSRAVDRVATISSEKSRAIRLSFSNNKLELSATSEENGEASETIEVNYQGDAMEVGFNSRYVLEMLTGIEGTAKFGFSDSGSPAVVEDAANVGALYVIMPMRI